MKINELAKQTDLPRKTIRYYEERGLIPAATRGLNGYREYGQIDVERLVFIRRCRGLQIPLDKIKKLVTVQQDRGASCLEVDQIIEEQLEKVKKTRLELTQLERALSHLAKACHKTTIDECEILHRLNKKT